MATCEQAGTALLGGESQEEYRARQTAWDERAAQAREQWGIWPEDEEEEDYVDAEELLYDQTFFKLRTVTPLARLMAAFCQRKEVARSDVDFVFGGQCIDDDDTPEG